MKTNKYSKPQNGVLTNPMNTDSKEFKELQLFLSNKADNLSEKQKIQLELFALQVKMEDYIKSTDSEDNITTVGDFLRLYIDKLGIKQNKLASYIGLKPSNLNKILSGTRKVNFELSFILGQIFNLDPKIWMLIQVKNEYIELRNNRDVYFKNFKLEDLVEGSTRS